MDNLFNQRQALFPNTLSLSEENQDKYLSIADISLLSLARHFGTPLYIYDRLTLDESVNAYRIALKKHYPFSSGITYAGKAFLCLAIVQWAMNQGIWIDCTGIGELTIAKTGGGDKESLLVHGVNKSKEDLSAALESAGTLVVDNLTELARLKNELCTTNAPGPNIWLRFRPGIAVDTHVYRQTGQDDSKFGMSKAELIEAILFGLEQKLPITGIHFHQGSHFHDPTPLKPAIETTLELVLEITNKIGWIPQALCVGGGWGVPYHESELPHPEIEAYVEFISRILLEVIRENDLPPIHLQLEPGRSLIARAGVVLYRVGTIKQTTTRRWLLLDGGLADNPRPALYGARYSALPVCNPQRLSLRSTWIAGPYCESGDILIEDLLMPDVQEGEYIAIPVAGAYQLSMSSNYNGARKPAVVWLDRGKTQLIQQREEISDLFRRDRMITLD